MELRIKGILENKTKHGTTCSEMQIYLEITRRDSLQWGDNKMTTVGEV